MWRNLQKGHLKSGSSFSLVIRVYFAKLWLYNIAFSHEKRINPIRSAFDNYRTKLDKKRHSFVKASFRHEDDARSLKNDVKYDSVAHRLTEFSLSRSYGACQSTNESVRFCRSAAKCTRHWHIDITFCQYASFCVYPLLYHTAHLLQLCCVFRLFYNFTRKKRCYVISSVRLFVCLLAG